jgi:Tfp pilus assembly PilM family ATPase
MKPSRVPRHPRRTVGLDVSQTHLAAVQLHAGHEGTFRLEKAGWAAPPPHATPQQLAAAVHQLFQQTDLAREHVCTAIKTPGLAVKHFRQPASLTPAELSQALSIEAEEMVQLPREELYLDWHPNSHRTPDNQSDGVLVVTPRKEVEQHLQMLALAGIYPRIVDIGCLAICNLYQHLRKQTAPDQATAILSLAQDRVDITILHGADNVFPRTVFSPNDTWDESEEYLAECVSDSIKYHQFVLHAPAVTRIVLTGYLPNNHTLINHLREMVPLTEPWDPVADLPAISPHLKPRLSFEIGSRLATSLGLALRQDYP